ncbi:urease accessory protein UreD [Jatrophihabitans endophyticus]|uniref:urease accessory protein UreD n=1 Tax=Jatrophihabitans endophyticus TaxID=1206085 RepID=UPI001A09D5AD|nr:urease accessory protein UreD [Jatrophihabitans endophyticus]MBE7189528.1 urease accessory protein UreD [Jatrophihabitans endophyticus]
MRVTGRAVVEAGGRLPVLSSAAPWTLRRVRSDDPTACALRLVGSAAGPLAGDELALHLELGRDARCELRATGASIAQGRGGAPSTLRTDVALGENAVLTADPGPLIVCDGSRVDVSLHLALAASATVRWDETVVLGRTTDGGSGTATIRWDVTRAGRPLLRQTVDLADPALRRWRGHLAGARVLASALVTGPGVRARTVIGDPVAGVRHAVAQRLDDTSVLVTVLADDVHLAAKARDDLVPALSAGACAALR